MENYKRLINFQDLIVFVETDKGEYRHWFDSNSGEQGSTFMQYPYGYVKGTLGLDGEEVDVYVGPSSFTDKVYVITQLKKPLFNEIDEQKVMLGFNNLRDAKTAYLRHYNDSRFFGDIKEMSIAAFKEKLSLNRGGLIKSKMAAGGFTTEEAHKVAKLINLDLTIAPFTVEEFKAGLNEELEHKDITHSAAVKTAKIALAHLKEDPKYYSKLKQAMKKSRLHSNTNSDKMLFVDLSKAFKPIKLNPASTAKDGPNIAKNTDEDDKLAHTVPKDTKLPEHKKSQEEPLDLVKALTAIAVSGLSKRERLNAVYMLGAYYGSQQRDVDTEEGVETSPQVEVGIDKSQLRPLYEPRPVPVRRISTDYYINPSKYEIK